MLIDMSRRRRRSRDRVRSHRPGAVADVVARRRVDRVLGAGRRLHRSRTLPTWRPGALRQLTDDVFADLQPAWSHDGRTIAFVTERFSSDLSIAAIRTAAARAAGRRTPGGPRHARCSPATPTSTRNGRPTIASCISSAILTARRMSFASSWNRSDRCAGSPTSIPASAASRRPARRCRWRPTAGPGVHGVRARPPAAGRARSRPRQLDGPAVVGRATAIRRSRADDAARWARSTRYLADHETGLPEADVDCRAATTRSRLSLEGIGQPYLSSGGGPFGTFVRGGGALLFGDMLGERRLGAAVQIGNRLRDAAFDVRVTSTRSGAGIGARSAELEPGVDRGIRASAGDRARRPAGAAAAGRLPAARAAARGGSRRLSVQPRLARRDSPAACGTRRTTAICDRRSRRWTPARCWRANRSNRAAGCRRRWRRSARRSCATPRSLARPARCSDRAIASRSRRRRGSCRTPASPPTSAAT